MSMLDTYRNNLLRKREEAAKLNQDLAKEQAKIAPLQQKIISANAAIGRTKSASTIKSKLNEIERANKAIADTQKKVGDIQKKLAQKEKEIAAAEKTYHNEETKVNKKAADAEKKRIQEASRQSAALEQAIHRQEQLQFQMRQEIDEMKALPEKITVLFLAANPKSTPQLNLDEEARAIREKSVFQNIEILFSLKAAGQFAQVIFYKRLTKQIQRLYILVDMALIWVN